ncbi:MAG: hypothetical protein E7357_07015 [Clostridiales bacterium]|nr:hypothetical protein [Clostridiales bacterium]
MLILYILLIAYIVAINFYAFILVKSLRDKERDAQIQAQAQPFVSASTEGLPTEQTNTPAPVQRYIGKLLITGLLGGAITIYVCMFILKFKRTELLLMVLMPLLGVLNIYMWVLLFKSGFGFLLIR